VLSVEVLRLSCLSTYFNFHSVTRNTAGAKAAIAAVSSTALLLRQAFFVYSANPV